MSATGENPVPTWERAVRRPPRRQLSRDGIVGAALTVLDAEGIAAVSMRRVAQELGTGAASLYAHVTDKNELHELMYDAVLGEIALPAADPARWLEQTRELLNAQLRALLSHPGIATVAWATMIPVGPNALRQAEALLSLLRAGGLDERQAAYGTDTLSLYTKAFAYEGSAWSTGRMDAHEIAERGAQITAYMRAQPDHAFVNLLATNKYLNAETAAERFEFGLNMLLGGLANAARVAG